MKSRTTLRFRGRWVAIHLATIAVAGWAAASPPPADPIATGGSSESWQSVLAPRPFLFPRDHAAHEDYRIEWWYYTGNLSAEDGRRFGYQLTFFRTGLVHSPKNPSRWSLRDLYVAHFAVSDIAKEEFTFHERVARRGIGWAGADRAATASGTATGGPA